MQIVAYTAIVMVVAGFSVVLGGWLVNRAFRVDAENGHAVLLGGKIYRMTEVDSNVTNSTVSSNIHKEG